MEKASQELINKIAAKRRLTIVTKGSDEARYLEFMNAEANAGGEGMNHILVRTNPTKAAILEEFLHGTQFKIGMMTGTGNVIPK